MTLDRAAVLPILPALMDALSDAVVVLDRDRRIVVANRRYVEAFGMKRADAPCAACPDRPATPRASADGGRCATCEALELGRYERRQRQIPDASGAVRRYEATFSPVLDHDGRATHVVEVWRDVTERSRLEVQLAHSERLASVGILAAGVAHEINNPLASMLAGVETLGRWLQRGRFDGEGVSEAAETIELLEHEIGRCRETTGKLRLLGRSYDTAPSWVDVNAAVRDTLALLRYELRTRGLEAVESLDPGLPQIWAREAGVRGICMNLMINAVQAMSTGGRLTVTTRSAGERIVLSIEDTGSGILREHLDRIWDPFFTTKPVGQGTGLGLSITHGIVTRHAGRIAVDSTPGHGTRFEVELPVHGPGGDG
jgi:PAS domain S-box-containing protein